MLVNAKEILNNAKQGGYAIAHFNINNLEWTKFILEECEALQVPVILGVSEGAIKYMGGVNTVVNLVKGLIMDLNPSIKVVLHLDHGSNKEICKKCIDAGFTSVMIDASKLSLEENIKETKEVVEYAKVKNVSVEAEIGCIGGEEDDINKEGYYAKVEDSKKLVDESGIDFIAPALGSVHGFYKGEVNLDFNRMEEMSKLLNIPLVLHGGTGIPDDLIKKAIDKGICKININTDLQYAWANAVKDFINNNPDVYDPRKIIKAGEQALKAKVREKIQLFSNQKVIQ